MLLDFLRTCVTRDRLTGADLLCTFISRRAHKICYMSGRLDPTRTSKVQLSLEGVARRVNHISHAKLPDNWQWGMEPFSRNDPPALVRRRSFAGWYLFFPLLCFAVIALFFMPARRTSRG